MSLTAERLKAMRLERQVRRHGGFLLLVGDTLHVYGAKPCVPAWLIAEVVAATNEMARHIRCELQQRARE